MKYSDAASVLATWDRRGRYVFLKRDLAKILREQGMTLDQTLARLVRAGLLERATHGVYLYALSAGVAHSAQYALAAMFGAAADGRYAFLEDVKEYGRRASRLKEIFLRNGFRLVYDSDMGDPVADGFYFTIGRQGMSGGELARELMYYGVSAIPLDTTGSNQQGVRICTSFISPHQYAQLDERMAAFDGN